MEREIVAAIRANGGTYTSAYRLIVLTCGRAWPHGYRCLDNLERRGVITCERSTPPNPMVIKLVKP